MVLASVRISININVDETERVFPFLTTDDHTAQQDQPRASSHDGVIAGKPGYRFPQTIELHDLAHRGRLASGHDQAIDVAEFLNSADLGCLKTEGLDRLTVHGKITLNRQQPNNRLSMYEIDSSSHKSRLVCLYKLTLHGRFRLPRFVHNSKSTDLQQLLLGNGRNLQAAHRLTQSPRDFRQFFGVIEVRHREDDRAGARRWIIGLEDS